MTGPITTQLHDDVLVIISNNPPVNALGAAVRQGLEAAIKDGVADASITAMVIRCDGRTFFAGADITEFTEMFAQDEAEIAKWSRQANDIFNAFEDLDALAGSFHDLGVDANGVARPELRDFLELLSFD